MLRKYNVDISGILQFLINQLKDSNSLDMLVLREMIAKMSGFEYTEDLNDHQLETQAGSHTLKLEVHLADTPIYSLDTRAYVDGIVRLCLLDSGVHLASPSADYARPC